MMIHETTQSNAKCGVTSCDFVDRLWSALRLQAALCNLQNLTMLYEVRNGTKLFVQLDAAGNQSTPSPALLVAHRTRPADAPTAIPAWAWQLLRWQQAGRSGTKPATPRPLPRWYWHWASWEAQPYRLTRYG